MRPASVAIVAVFILPAVAGCFTSDPGLTIPAAACTLGTETYAPPEGPRAPRAPTTYTIRTDAFGVSHVYADTAYGLSHGNGYVQARDRFFQMDILRHVAYGDSASVLGESQLESDLSTRQFLYSPSEIADQYAASAPWVKEMLTAFSDGVNRFLAEATATGALPGEFAALGHVPEPWTPEDTTAVAGYLTTSFGVFGGNELENARIFTALEDNLGNTDAAHAALDDIAGGLVTDGRATPAIPPIAKVVPGCEPLGITTPLVKEQLDRARATTRAERWGVANDVIPAPLDSTHRPAGDGSVPTSFAIPPFRWGSNALLVDGSRSATGQPLMFGGPQMGYYKPAVPYEIGLHGAGFDVVGMGVAGAPGVLVGRTPTFAWTVTSGYDDMVDMVVLDLDPADPHRYAWDGAWETMDCRIETHRVTNILAPDATRIVEQEVCRARGMPVASWSPDDNLAWARRETTRGEPAYIPWGLIGSVTDLDGFLDVLAAMPYSFNFHYAGPEGIAMIHTGSVPTRATASDARLPIMGGDANAWQGITTGKALGTHVVNPETGYLVNWNNPPAAMWRIGDLPYAWQGVHRVDLLDAVTRATLAGAPQGITLDDVAGILKEAATRDAFAGALVPHLVAAARTSGDTALAPVADAMDAWARTGYAWADADDDGFYDDAGHAAWDAVRIALQDAVMRDELGDRTRAVAFDPAADNGNGNQRDHGGFTEDGFIRNALDGQTVHPWCDNVTTPAVESCQDTLVRAMRTGLAALEERHGDGGPDTWREPRHHNRFAPFGATAPETIPMVNRGSWNQLVAIGGGLEGAWSVLPPGNSGHVDAASLAGGLLLSGGEPEHTGDQLDLYRNFEYKPFPVTADEVAQVTVRTETVAVV